MGGCDAINTKSYSQHYDNYHRVTVSFRSISVTVYISVTLDIDI